MPLLDEGALSFGGSVVGRSINLELRRAANATLGLNDSEARFTANIIPPETEISMYDFYGKTYYVFGQYIFDNPGTYDWVVPEGVRSVSVVCIGGGGGGSAGPSLIGFGGGGGGGALAYRNDIPVVPGETYTIVVGEGGQQHVVVNGETVQSATSGKASSAFSCVAGGGSAGADGTGGEIGIQSSSGAGGVSSGVRNGGGNGGVGGVIDTSNMGYRIPGGGGAGGYAFPGGKGADGKRTVLSPSFAAGQSGSPGNTGVGSQGGGGGGGGSGFISTNTNHIPAGRNTGGGGGGISLLGYSPGNNVGGSFGLGGQGQLLESYYVYPELTPRWRLVPLTGLHSGGAAWAGPDRNSSYGAGGGGGWGGDNREAISGNRGAVRIIWPGNLRKYPDIFIQNA